MLYKLKNHGHRGILNKYFIKFLISVKKNICFCLIFSRSYNESNNYLEQMVEMLKVIPIRSAIETYKSFDLYMYMERLQNSLIKPTYAPNHRFRSVLFFGLALMIQFVAGMLPTGSFLFINPSKCLLFIPLPFNSIINSSILITHSISFRKRHNNFNSPFN